MLTRMPFFVYHLGRGPATSEENYADMDLHLAYVLEM